MITAIDLQGVDVAGIMHSPIHITGAALNALQSLWQGPTAVYPNSGYFKMPCWQLDSVIKPTSFAQAVRPQFQKGARVLQALAAEFKIELHG